MCIRDRAWRFERGQGFLVTGAGLGSPGNSPGILTVSQTDPSGGMDFAFELTAIGDPLWSNAGASVNDVWRNTPGSDPFAGGTFDSDNVIDIYFGVGVLASGDMFRGGFFTDFNSDFLSTVSAEFRSYRDTLRHDLTRPNVSVAVPEEFLATGSGTPDMPGANIRPGRAGIPPVGAHTRALAPARGPWSPVCRSEPRGRWEGRVLRSPEGQRPPPRAVLHGPRLPPRRRSRSRCAPGA